jgi:hypothetical protein
MFRLKMACRLTAFRGFLTLWRKLHLRNSLYNEELAIFSEEPLETPLGFPEVPIIQTDFPPAVS